MANDRLEALRAEASVIHAREKDIVKPREELAELDQRKQDRQSELNKLAAPYRDRLNELDSKIDQLRHERAGAEAYAQRYIYVAERLEAEANTLPQEFKQPVSRIEPALEVLEENARSLARKLAAAEAAGNEVEAAELRRQLAENEIQQDALRLLQSMAGENNWLEIGPPEMRETAQRARELAANATAEAERLAPELTAAETERAQVEDEMNKALAPLREELDALEAKAAPIREALAAPEAELLALRNAHEAALEALYGQLEPEVPLALLPVRLETRFTASGLLVRVYPDDIHQDSHQPLLTESEMPWREYFRQTPKEQQPDAWRQLVGRFGARRAAYIAAGPDVDEVTARRSHTTRTELLPDRWRVIGYTLVGQQLQQQFAEYGKLIPQPLQTGLRLPDSMDAGGIETFFDEETRWLVDFTAAEQVGMGIRILPDKVPANGLDLLLVYGIKGTLAAEPSAGLLADALSAHTHTWGLALAPQGTATNNTEGEATIYSPTDLDADGTAWLINGRQLAEDHDGFRLARALGITTAMLARAECATTAEQQEVAAMNAVLYPATWGYILRHLQENWNHERQNYERFWRYFIDRVRGRGPLPVLRIHDQPYGILPVSTLEPVASGKGAAQDWAFQMLLRLRNLWRDLLRTEPRIDSSDPNGSLARILSLQPVSRRYLLRRLVGSGAIQAVLEASGHWVDGEMRDRWDNYLDLRQKAWAAQGLGSANSPLLTGLFDVSADLLGLTLVQATPSGAADLLTPNYIEELLLMLRAGRLSDIYDQTSVPGTPLLLRLLRHSLLSLAVELSVYIEPDEVPGEPEPELIDFAQEEEMTVTGWRRLYRQTTGGERLLDVVERYLVNPDEASEEYKGLLRDYVASLERLSKLPVSRLELLLSESLDLSSHRLDAWFTSVATDRLEQMRQGRPTGLHLGGYGWVENLRPRSSARRRAGGYIHAPSTTHAAAAAILRSGYLSPPVEVDKKLWAIDLSSARVRRALELLEGVRAGQSLGALLGYRFERALHDHQLDKHINSFRQLAPSTAGKQTPLAAGESVEAVAARDIVEGLALLRRWQKGRDTNKWDKSTIPSELQSVAAKHLAALEEAVDGVSDLLVAESAYQAVRGNSLRAGATLDALSRGETPPVEIEVARSARSGVALTHRVLLTLDGNPTLPGDWPWPADRPRARMEPALNRWAGRLLGDPAWYEAMVSFHDAAGKAIVGNPALPTTVKLVELGLAPLDVIALAAPAAASEAAGNAPPGLPDEGDLGSPLGRLLVAHLLLSAAAANVTVAAVSIDFHVAPANKLPLVALFELARVTRTLLAETRPLRPDDFARPAGPPPLAVANPALLKERADNAMAAFSNARAVLDKQLKTSPLAADDLRTALLGVVAFTTEAVPVAAPGSEDEPTALRAQAEAVAGILTRRNTDLQKLEMPAAGADDAAVTAYHAERLKIIVGAEFPILPPLVAPDGEFQALWSAVPKGITPAAVFRWLGQAARLRERVDRLHEALLYADTLGDTALGEFHVVQQPALGEGEKWVGLDYNLADQETFPGGRLSLVINSSDPPADTIAGLYIDDWVEVVPSRSEVTGVAFHFDAPQAAAPQAILLALHPSLGKNWDADLLATVIRETRELSRMRLLTPGQIKADEELHQQITHLLPALFFAQNDDPGATVSMKFVD